MNIPKTLFELKLSANYLMGLKVCKLLGTRPKKSKSQFQYDFFNRAKSLKHRRWEAFFVNSAAKPPGKAARPSRAAAGGVFMRTSGAPKPLCSHLANDLHPRVAPEPARVLVVSKVSE